MNFSVNHALISLNTAPMFQNYIHIQEYYVSKLGVGGGSRLALIMLICERFQKNIENKQTITNDLIPSDPMIGWSTVITRPVVTVMDNK